MSTIDGKQIGLVPNEGFEELKIRVRRSEAYKTNKSEEILKLLRFCFVGESQVTCYQRPVHTKLKIIKDLHNITMVVSILSETEFPEEIAKSCAAYGLKHWIINLDKADEETMEDEDKMEKLILDLKELYKFFQNNSEKVLLHCMSGI